MLELNAQRFVELTNVLRAITHAGRVFPEKGKQGGHADPSLAEVLRGHAKQLAEMRLPTTEGAVLILAESVERYGQYNDLANERVGSVCQILRLETKGRTFFQIEDADLYSQEQPLFGENVALEFPKAAYDISEAGKCLACSRATASVFHLMRVVEVGIGRLGEALSTELNPRWGWQKLINAGLEPAVNALPEMTEGEIHRKKMLQQARAHLHAIRLAWRNDTMHPKEQYDPEEAKEIFGHVKTFMKHLVDHL